MTDLAAEIRDKVSILDLCEKAGREVDRRSWFMFSPYKDEKTPSCKIYVKSNSFKDYSTDQAGSVIDLYMAFYNVDAGVAIKELAQIYGIEGTKTDIRRAPVKPKAVRESEDFIASMSETERNIYDLELPSSNEAAVIKKLRVARLAKNREIFFDLYYYCITKGWYDTSAWEYLVKTRMLDPKFVEKFDLFFINNYNEVNNHLKKSFTLKELQRSGLYNVKDDGSGNLIFYAHRLIIPYRHNNSIVYLRGRYFDQDGNTKTDGNKYLGLRNDGFNLNTPKRFFNMDVTKQALGFEKLYITEGEFDAIVMESLGYNCIAIPGAGNIPDLQQFRKLESFDIVLCGDNDEAGETLIGKVARIFSDMGKLIKIKRLPAKDVNDFLIQSENKV